MNVCARLKLVKIVTVKFVLHFEFYFRCYSSGCFALVYFLFCCEDFFRVAVHYWKQIYVLQWNRSLSHFHFPFFFVNNMLFFPSSHFFRRVCVFENGKMLLSLIIGINWRIFCSFLFVRHICSRIILRFLHFPVMNSWMQCRWR